jgi:hypothetical protein
MKKIILLTFLLSSISALAATVKITSYNYIGTGTRLAELCGLVENAAAAPTYVKVMVDPNTSKPATYNTFAGDDGRFCIAVISYRGTAEASLFGEATTVKAAIK